MKPIIEIKNLSAGYDGRTVLHDVNLSIYERDFLGIIGPNGGGKTTLIKCILGLLKPTGGEIIFHTPEKAPHKNIYGRDFDRNICQKLPPKFFRKIPAFPRLPAAIQHHKPEVPYFRGRSDPVRIEHTKVADLPVHSRTRERKANRLSPAWGLKGLKAALSDN